MLSRTTTEVKAGNIRLRSAGLSERPNGEIIAMGFLDIPSMLALKVDDYQREVLTGSNKGIKSSSLQKAIHAGAGLPAIVLGMRGERYRDGGGDMVLEDQTFIVDGLQRVTALLRYAEENPESAHDLRIGAEVRFGTSKIIEKDLFEILNTRRTPVSPNVILRNMRDTNKAILTLYGLSKSDTSSLMYGKVQWQQRMARGELISGSMLVRTAFTLHTIRTAAPRGSVTGGSTGGNSVASMASGLEHRAASYGLRLFRDNVLTFFTIVDECFDIKNVAFSKMAPHLKGNFLVTLAKVFSDHKNFWDDSGTVLSVNTKQREKIRAFPIRDPEISRLCAAGNTAMVILYRLVVDHYDKGRTKGRLVAKRKSTSAA